MQFVFVTAISISTSETQGKLTQYQHTTGRKKNQKILHPVDQPLADLDLENQMESGQLNECRVVDKSQ